MLNADYGDKGDVGCMTQWDMGPSGPCRTPGAVDIVKGMCDGQGSCELAASNDVFGDSCPDSNKYLEVNYDCQAGRWSVNVTPVILLCVATVLAKLMWDTLAKCNASIIFHMETNVLWAKFYLLPLPPMQ